MKDDEQMTVAASETVKKRGKGGKFNFPNAIEIEDPADVKEALGSVLYWMQKGRESKPKTNDEIQDRCDEYILECYQTGQRMTVEKLALALGITRKCLWEWEQANDERGNIIQKAKDMIACYDADMVTSGKMNPVPYIFRAKNYYGMKDQSDIVIEPKQGITEENAMNVAEKYAQLPGD